MINILVIEDDEKLNDIVCSFLNNKGYRAISCKNGSEACEKASQLFL